MLGKRIGQALAVGAPLLAAFPVFAASDVSGSQPVTSVASPIVSSQTSSIVSSAISGAVGGGFVPSSGGGGFTPGGGGGGGGFTPGGSGGGFTPGGGGGGVSPGGGGGGVSPSGGGGSSPGGGPQPENKSSLDGVPYASTRQMGLSAGSDPAKLGIWTQGTASRIVKTEQFLKMDGFAYSGVLGVDYKFTPDVVVGVAGSYEHVDLDTGYNRGSYDGSGFSLMPYVGVGLGDGWSWDASVGYGWLNYDVTRNAGANKASYDSERFSVSTNLIGFASLGGFMFQPKVGLMYINESQDAYKESGTSGNHVGADHSEFGRATAGSKIGYAFGNSIPYIKLYGEWDFLVPEATTKSNGQKSEISRGGGVAGLGYEIHSGGLVASIEGNYNSLFRKDLDIWTAAARLRWEF
jgi:hypothetical protein